MTDAIKKLQERCWDLMLHQPDEALALANKSLQLIESSNSPNYLGNGLFMKGWCHYYAGRYSDADNSFQAAISAFMDNHELDQIARVYNGLGAVFQAMGQFVVSLQHYETSLSMLPLSETIDGHIAVKTNLVSLYCSANNWSAAQSLTNELDQLDLSNLSDESLGEYYYIKAFSQIETGSIDDLNHFIRLAETYSKRLGFQQLIFHVGILRARWFDKKGDTQKAIDVLLHLCDTISFEQQGVERYQAFTLLAQWYSQLGYVKRARQYYHDGLSLEQQLWPHQFLLDLLVQYSQFLAEQHNFKESLDYQKKAYQMQAELFAKNYASTESNQVVSREIARLRRDDLAKEAELKSITMLHDRTYLINKIGQNLASTFDIGSIGLRLYDLVSKELDVIFIAIVEYIPEKSAIQAEILVDQGVALPTTVMPLDTPGLQTSLVIKTRKTILKRHYEPSPESKVDGPGSDPKSAIFLPLEVENELIGVWSLQSLIEDRFDESDIELLEALAPFVAIAFNNALSHRRLKELNLEIHREKDSVIKANKKIEHQALHDGLTGLPNRRQLSRIAIQKVEEAKQQNKKFHLLYIDLNQFKPINDIHGHFVGDQVLKEVGQRLQVNFRNSDLLARVGGDEFVALVSEFSETDRLSQFIDYIKNELNKPFLVEEQTFVLGASIGIATFPQDGGDLDRLMHYADQQMYLDKRGQ